MAGTRPGRNGGTLKSGGATGGGRPKKIPDLHILLANVLGDEKDGKTAAEAILMALRAKATKGDVRAAELLLDRAYGKAKQEIVGELQLNRVIRPKHPDDPESE